MDHPHVTNLMESEHESSTPIQDENARSTQIPSSMDGIHGFSNSTPTSSGTPIGPTSSMKDDNATYNPKRLKSAVWEHFTREEICGEWKAICNYCKRMLGGKSRNGTTHLHDHLRRCASRTHKDPKQQLLLSKQNKVDGTTTLTNYAFNQTFARNELGRMIIMHEYPLSMVDHWGFRRYSSALQPIFNIPCRNTIRNDILKVYKEEKLKTMRMIEMNDSRVAITTDMWTADHQKKGYMALTAHFIDASWVLQKRILRMLEKFDKYWSAVHGFMGIATVFDPRYKKCMLEYHFSKIYGDVCDVEIDRIECICRDLLSEYQTKYSDFEVGKSTLSSSTLAQKNNVTDGYDEFLSRRKSGSTQKKSEFDFYLEEDVLPRSPNFDILQWWKTAGVKYPMMQRIAKDLYAIPVSSVASECAFSTGGRLLSASRSRLHPTMVEALTCAQNWLGNQSEDPNTDLSEIPSTCMEEDDINFMAFDLD